MRWNRSKTVLWAACFVLAAGTAYPEEAAMTLDDIIPPGTKPEVIGTGYGFCEGPAADAQGNIYFSDGRKNSIHFYEVGKPVTLFVNDSTDANGMMFNAKGELYVCEGAAYRVVAFDVKTKEKRVLVSEIDGTHFNEPNDLAIDQHGGFYFTDPNYRHNNQPTVMKEDAYYCSADGKVTRVSTVCRRPNGVLLSADGKTLYLADHGGMVIYKYDVEGPGKLANETKWANVGGSPDGMTLDEHGNLYACCGSSIRIFSPQGKPIGTIQVRASNCCFGGKDFDTLYATASGQFLGIKTKVHGLKPLCLRQEAPAAEAEQAPAKAEQP